jgi:hypothetical protein
MLNLTPAGALSVVCSNFTPKALTFSVGPAAPLGAGAGVALALATLSASQASNSAPVSARTSKSMMLCPEPHSSAHWPRNVWPASDSLTVNSNWFG